jgi:dTDP-4-amino-4,6-dideoxygalactose transaminase
VHGALGKHRHAELGGNYRLDALQAAFLRVKLPHAPRWQRARAEHFRAYAAGLAGIGQVVVPRLPRQAESAHALFSVRVLDGRRDALAAWLAEQGLPSAVYYPRPLHAQPALESLGYRQGQFPNAELLSEQVLSLPLFAEMLDGERDRVIDAVRMFFR